MAVITPMNQKPAYQAAYTETIARAKTMTDRQLKKAQKAAHLYANQGRNIFTDEHATAVGTADAYDREDLDRGYAYLARRAKERRAKREEATK